MPEYFFTADQHWGHTNILRLCNRPFYSVDEMNEVMIAKWNARVGLKDVVYHLGDFAWKNRAAWFRSRLHGTIWLIQGNHDGTINPSRDGFVSARQMNIIEIGDTHIVLCHYPLEEWEGAFRGYWHLHGHCHGRARIAERRLDVGVDAWDFQPVAFDEIKERMKEFQSDKVAE